MLQLWAEQLDDPDLLRMRRIEEMYADPDDPIVLANAQIQEVMRRYAVELGVCGDCLAKFPDPLADDSPPSVTPSYRSTGR